MDYVSPNGKLFLINLQKGFPSLQTDGCPEFSGISSDTKYTNQKYRFLFSLNFFKFCWHSNNFEDWVCRQVVTRDRMCTFCRNNSIYRWYLVRAVIRSRLRHKSKTKQAKCYKQNVHSSILTYLDFGIYLS